ncbi:MAG: pyridoxamine 5'-phosphate oxidase [Streptosporangiales bacterium]|nr:pyridoxamine 5'-phosphate oxidase [Streptosporangiales bacterium]
MASRREQIRMTEDEVTAFLNEQMKVQIGTVGRDGAPHLSTLFYAMVDGRLAYWTYAKSQKVVNLARNPAMTCLVDAGEKYDELRGVVLYGTGAVVEDPDTVMRVGAHVASRMNDIPLSTFDDPAARAGLERSGAKRVAITMSVDRVVSWDHRKL